MFRIEAAGYPIVMHVHDECVAEVPIGFGSEEEFLKLMTQQPSWAPDLPIAASAWRGPRYDKSDKPVRRANRRRPRATPAPEQPPARDETIIMKDTTQGVRVDDVSDVDNDGLNPNPRPIRCRW